MNPTEFFRNAKYYPSQGRGEFTISAPPKVLEGTSFTTAQGAWIASHPLATGLFAKSINMPGSNLGTFEDYSLSGPTRKQPHSLLFGPVTVEFYLMGADIPKAQLILDTFVTWQENIVSANYPPGAGNSPLSALALNPDQHFYALSYYEDYTVDATAKILSPHDETIIEYKYTGLYPQALSGLSTSWDNQDAPLTLSVTFECYAVRLL